MRLTIVFSPWRSTQITQRSLAPGHVRKPSVSTPFGGQVLANPLADSVGADCGDEANLLSATRQDHGLVGALAAKIVGGSARDHRLTRPRKAIEPDHGVDRRIADDVDHVARPGLARPNKPLERLAPEPRVSRPGREFRRQPVRADVRGPSERAALAETSGNE